MRIASIVGARPQFIKLAAIVSAVAAHNLSGRPRIDHAIIHTGQHYDYEMDAIFFGELGLPAPDHHLGVGSGRHGLQTGTMIRSIEDVLLKENPDFVLVYGDTNTTLAGAISASKLHVPIAHIEAGLRSFNRRMPEEINRVLTDHCSDVLFCPTQRAVRNLMREGFENCHDFLDEDAAAVERSRLDAFSFPIVIASGDVMLDSLDRMIVVAEKTSDVLSRLSLVSGQYYLLTIHRSENTEHRDLLYRILSAMCEIHSQGIPVIFSVHPRTLKAMRDFGLYAGLEKRIRILDRPLGYLDMLVMEKNARKIFTDSGGVQKEAFFLRVPCVTLRKETEWTETVEAGANVLVGSDPADIIAAAGGGAVTETPWETGAFGTGRASEVIVRGLAVIGPGR